MAAIRLNSHKIEIIFGLQLTCTRALYGNEFDDQISQLCCYCQQIQNELLVIRIVVGDIKVDLLNGIDGYFQAQMFTCEWCSLVRTFLETCFKLSIGHSESKAQAQNRLLKKVLIDDLHKMIVAQTDAERTIKSLNAANEMLSALLAQLDIDYKPSSSFVQMKLENINQNSRKDPKEKARELKKRLGEIVAFYSVLRNEIDQATQSAIKQFFPLNVLISNFEYLGHRFENLSKGHTIDDDAELRESIQNLIAKCQQCTKPKNV